jgi:hypothetical protein
MDLVRDVLDKLVTDRNGREMGRVDGVVLEAADGRPPVVVAIEMGPSVVGYRLHPVCGRLAEAAEHVLGIDEGRPCRIAFEDITEFGITLRTASAVGSTTAAAAETWARKWLPPAVAD